MRVERLIHNYKECGKLDSEDPVLLMLKKWPAAEQYRDGPDKLPGLEKLVCLRKIMSNIPKHILQNDSILSYFRRWSSHPD